MDILVDADLYHQDETEKIGEGEHAIRYLVYRITDKGRDYVMTTPSQKYRFCVADIQVEQIFFPYRTCCKQLRHHHEPSTLHNQNRTLPLGKIITARFTAMATTE